MVSEYTLKARVFPTILTSLPLILLSNALLEYEVKDWLNSSEYAALFGRGSVSLAVVFLLAQINRFIGAEVIQRLLSGDEVNFPTTRMLLPNNPLISDALRDALLLKIKKKMGYEIPTCIDTENEPRVRRLIVDCVREMRGKTRANKLLLQHNIEYGFARNLIGGCLVALLVSILNMWLYQYELLTEIGYKISAAYCSTALIFLLISPWVLERYGIKYARLLFQAYLESK